MPKTITLYSYIDQEGLGEYGLRSLEFRMEPVRPTMYGGAKPKRKIALEVTIPDEFLMTPEEIKSIGSATVAPAPIGPKDPYTQFSE